MFTSFFHEIEATSFFIYNINIKPVIKKSNPEEDCLEALFLDSLRWF